MVRPTGPVLRDLLAHFENSYYMKRAINERWTKYDRRVGWSACAELLLAELSNDQAALTELHLHLAKKGVTLPQC